MSNETEALLLKAVLEQYATPDPKIVGTIPRNGINLAYVSHAEITRILIEIDPMWNWQPVAWVDGRPAIHEANGVATMWGTLTLLGKSLVGVGSVRADKPDLDKELVGDFLRNAAMRFGICLSLWSKQDWETPRNNVSSVHTSYPMSQVEVEKSKQAHPANVQPKNSVSDALSDAQIEQAFTTPPKPTAKIGSLISDKQKGLVSSLGKEVADGDISAILKQLFDKTNLNTLTTKEGSDLIKHLMGMRQKKTDEQPF
jgi:hypothetical protein